MLVHVYAKNDVSFIYDRKSNQVSALIRAVVYALYYEL